MITCINKITFCTKKLKVVEISPWLNFSVPMKNLSLWKLKLNSFKRYNNRENGFAKLWFLSYNLLMLQSIRKVKLGI